MGATYLREKKVCGQHMWENKCGIVSMGRVGLGSVGVVQYRDGILVGAAVLGVATVQGKHDGNCTLTLATRD